MITSKNQVTHGILNTNLNYSSDSFTVKCGLFFGVAVSDSHADKILLEKLICFD